MNKKPIQVHCYKANPMIKNEPVQSIALVFDQQLPEIKELKEYEKFYEQEADYIVGHLLSVLPGGVVHQILVKLLQHKVSLLAVKTE